MTRLIEIPFSKSFASKFRLEDEFSRSQKKKYRAVLKSIFFRRNCSLSRCKLQEKSAWDGLGLPLYRQPPLCVFDDGFNLSVCHNLNIVV